MKIKSKRADHFFEEADDFGDEIRGEGDPVVVGRRGEKTQQVAARHHLLPATVNNQPCLNGARFPSRAPSTSLHCKALVFSPVLTSLSVTGHMTRVCGGVFQVSSNRTRA